jgi:hypothetical protein
MARHNTRTSKRARKTRRKVVVHSQAFNVAMALLCWFLLLVVAVIVAVIVQKVSGRS